MLHSTKAGVLLSFVRAQFLFFLYVTRDETIEFFKILKLLNHTKILMYLLQCWQFSARILLFNKWPYILKFILFETSVVLIRRVYRSVNFYQNPDNTRTSYLHQHSMAKIKPLAEVATKHSKMCEAFPVMEVAHPEIDLYPL